MATRVDAPIVQKIYDLYKLYFDYIDHIPRKAREVLGRKIEHLILELLEQVASASFASPPEKLRLLHRASTTLDILKTLVRLCYDLKMLNQKKYIALETKLQEIGRMLGGWIRSLNK